MKVYNTISDLVGKTPLVSLDAFTKEKGAKATILAKVEYFNPSGSVKDRAALYMLRNALKNHLINENTHIIEPTSGNTGIGLAQACAALKLKLTLTLPESMSKERRAMLKAYGANLVLTDASLGMKGAIEEAKRLHKENHNSIIPSQFDNLSNVQAHYETTGPEIYNDTDKLVNIVVAGVGTGGTITGIGKYLKEQDSSIKMVAIEPKDSAVLSGEKAGPHAIQGIGAGFIPSILDTSIIDEILKVSNEDAIFFAKELAVNTGIFCGISSGAAIKGALEIAKRDENKDKIIVVILPDSGDRYLSTALLN